MVSLWEYVEVCGSLWESLGVCGSLWRVCGLLRISSSALGPQDFQQYSQIGLKREAFGPYCTDSQHSVELSSTLIHKFLLPEPGAWSLNAGAWSLEQPVCFSLCFVLLYSRAITQVCKARSVRAPPNRALEEWPPAAASFYNPGVATCLDFPCRCGCRMSWWQLIKPSLEGTKGARRRQLDEAVTGIKTSRTRVFLKRQNPGGCRPLEQECAPLT